MENRYVAIIIIHAKFQKTIMAIYKEKKKGWFLLLFFFLVFTNCLKV